ncbi:MobQ family relaxase [Acinetobacter indicus]|uniref:MobQ family relaxase n=4 Tax=Acinetobacter TaxID=469 RepID=UPI001443F323|nr:MobQ family relaxase [Acinetobacter indicus]
MSIYHLSVKAISRSDGRSAVACAAYRAGEKLLDDRYGKEQDYTKKTGVEFTNIYAPPNTNPELLDRQTLWNTVEKVERRKDAVLAREFEIAFPHELNAEQRKQLLDELCQKLVEKYGVVVDAAIHAPHTESGSDARNYHAHIMFTTRAINENGEFSAKKYRDFSRDNGTETVCDWRADFADLCNKHLALAGFDERVDHRSYADQNKDYLEPTVHEGPAVTAMRRRGIDTEISLNNDEIKVRNADAIERHEQIIKGLDQEIIVPQYINDQILELENELQLTDAEERELLAEFANLDQQEEQLQMQQSQAIDYAYDQFLALQHEYQTYARNYYHFENIKNKAIADKQLERDKSVRYMQKNGYENDNLFISAVYSNHAVQPDWFVSEKDLNAFKHAQHKTFKESAKDDLQQIARIYSELERHAKILQDHDIELPTATKEEKSLFGLIKKEVELDFGWRDLDAKMYETGEYRQVLTEISDDESKHDAKLRSDALDRSLVQEWSNDLAKENKERIAQENANKQHIQNKPENTVQNTVKPKQKEISKDDSPSPGF